MADLLFVSSGERTAVDGIVVSGSISVNQATITGRSVAVEKKAGDQVYAGTLNEVGALEVLHKNQRRDRTWPDSQPD